MSDEGRTARRKRRRAHGTAAGPARYVLRPAQMSPGGAAGLADSAVALACELLESVGMVVDMAAGSRERLEAAGLAIDNGRLRLPRSLTEQPADGLAGDFLHRGATDAASVRIGRQTLAFGSTGAARVLWGDPASRRQLVREDVHTAISLTGNMPLAYGSTGLALGLDAEPAGARLALFMAGDDRPLIVPPRSGLPAAAFAIALRALAGHEPADMGKPSCRLLHTLATTAPLALDAAAIEVLEAVAASREGLLIAPTLLIGANTPASVEGALVRFAAELVAIATLVGLIGPGLPVAAGATIADVSMRNGLPLYATADALAVLDGAVAIAHRLGFAFCALGPATSAKGLDAAASADTALWLTAASAAGANAVVGAIGAVEGDGGYSPAKLLIDAGIARELLAASGSTPAEAGLAPAALELAQHAAGGFDFLGSQTARARAAGVLARMPGDEMLYESWAAAGGPDLCERLRGRIEASGSGRSAGDSMDSTTRRIDEALARAGISPTAARPAADGGLADLAMGIYSRSLREAFGFREG